MKILLIICCAAFSIQAETLRIPTSYGVGADASVSGADLESTDGDADTTFGELPELTFKGSPNINYHSAVYLRFDLSPLQGRTVRSARLELHTMDGSHFGVEELVLQHSSSKYHRSEFADIRIARSFEDLVRAQNLIVSTEFTPSAPNRKRLDGIESGLGFAETWSATSTQSKVTGDVPSIPGWTARGSRIEVKGTARRPLAGELKTETGVLWLGGFLMSSNSARRATVSFGKFAITHNEGNPIALNGISAGTESRGGLNLFIARLEFHPTGNRLALWANPDVSQGKSGLGEPDVSLVKVDQDGNLDASLYGLKPDVAAGPRPGEEGDMGLTQLGADWLESDLTWNNAPGGYANTLKDRSATGDVYHLYSLNLKKHREGLVATVTSPKLAWYVNKVSPRPATFILVGRDDRNLPFASKENPALPPPTLVVEVD